MSALERSFAGVAFMMCANRKGSRTRGCIFTRNLLALVAPRFTRQAAARGAASAHFLAFEFGGISATSHDGHVFTAW